MVTLRISLMDVFQAWLDDQPLSNLRSRREYALLAYLAVEQKHVHRRENLAELIWPDRRPGVALNNLRQSIYNLRKALQPSHDQPAFLAITRQTARFDPHSSHWLDVAEFEQRIEAVQVHCGFQSQQICLDCAAQLDQAVNLSRGEFLAGLDLSDSREFQEWLYTWREQLIRTQIRALHALITHHYAQGALDNACRYTEILLRVDPLQESAYRQLMRILVDMGQPQAALLQYRRCKELLSAEFGLEPDAETETLYQEISTLNASNTPWFAAVSSPPEPVRPSLSRHLTPFFGRQAEIGRLESLLSQPEIRLVTLVGPGGVGKTRLALAFTAEHGAQWPDGAGWVALDSLPGDASADALASLMGQQLKIALQPHQLQAQLCEALQPRRMLLIIDNFDHLLNGVSPPAIEFLLELLHKAPFIKVIVTSRQPLQLLSEQIFDVTGLPYPACEWQTCAQQFDFDACRQRQQESGCGLADPLAYSAVQLFFERARRVRIDLTPDDVNLAAVVRICQLVDGHPLALELAATWTRQHSAAQIAQQISANLDTLAADLHDLPERQRSLRKVFEYSWNLLSPEQQDFYRRLAVFRAAFLFETAQQITGLQRQVADEFLGRAMIRRRSAGRYELHPLLRGFAAEKLTNNAKIETEIRSRHSRFYLAMLWEGEKHLGQQDSRVTIEQLNGELSNLYAAWDWAVQEKWHQELMASIAGFSLFFSLAGLFQDGQALFSATIEKFMDPPADPNALLPEQASLCAQLWIEKTRFLYKLGQYPAALDTAQVANEYARASKDSRQSGLVYYFWGDTLRCQGQYSQAEAKLEQALAEIRKAEINLQTQKSRAEILNALAGVSLWQGNYPQAGDYLQQVLTIHQQFDDHQAEGKIWNNLGVVALEQGLYEEALRCHRQSFQIRQQIGDQSGQGVSHGNLGNLYLYLGQYSEAETHYQQALMIQRKIGDAQAEALTMCNLGLLFHYLGNLEQAYETIWGALQIAEQIDDRRTQGVAWMELAQVLTASARLEQAVDAYQKSIAIRRGLKQPGQLAESLAGLAEAYLSLEQLPPAQACVTEILSISDDCRQLWGAIDPVRICLICYRVLLAGQDVRASQVLRSARQELQQRSARISDGILKQSFLEAVASHRELARIWNTLPDESARSYQPSQGSTS
ncbi:MAG: tetratricopeptide repeat protein [Anaerolineales bacterium]|nr:tetratricopeptide repeat protein [Anaerolineales bacterium]